MGVSSPGLPRARTLGAALRHARKSSGLSLRDVGQRISLAHSTIGRWESGDSMPTAGDVAALLDVLNVSETDRAKLMALVHDSADTARTTGPGPSGTTQQLAGILECERNAQHITYWSPLVIPGVLQTSDYARSIFEQSTLSPAEVQALVTMRMGRRDVFMRADPAELLVLVGEWAILGGIGGPKTMCGQLQHLLAMSRIDAIDVRVVPLTDGWHPGHSGAFVLYKFGFQPSVVHFEHYRSGAFLVDKDDIADYESAVDAIRQHAMTAEESVDHISEALAKLEV